MQAGPPGLLVPAIAAGVATGVYRGAVDDYTGQPYYNNGPTVVDTTPLIPSGTSGQIYNDTSDVGRGTGGYADGDDEDVLPPPARYLEDNYDINGKFEDGE